VHELLDGIVDRAPIVANKSFAALRRMCAWAVERGIVDSSPCAGIRAPAPERSRDRVLSDDELRAAWKASEVLGWPFGPMVQLLILTGQRRDEIAEMRWGEIDLAAEIWILPRERSKNDQAHIVPLSETAVAILSSLTRITGKDGFVFTTNGATAVSGFSRAKRRLDALLPEGTPPWVIHDLRRTAASGMARLGINLPVIEKVLNHVSGSFGGIVGVYQRHGFEAEKRHALDSWARHVEALTSGEPANKVISMTKLDSPGK
jgi:integrase